ncbi:GfV-A7-ORF1 [Ichnoviriform fumiferanae]|uniref:GfV-A7-ORF1 n=1 Tax=Ichnoviriform fumiferanae TaxID=419435 RepID=A2PZQ0_9VIRU|nr:GfV-A7-ORF1 [Ichnoviriform fumiferanae]BAF45472.1 GfV-A7-ORF1 [Ichnoviriform fumiferanae]
MCHSFTVFHCHSWNSNGVPTCVEEFTDFIGRARPKHLLGLDLPLAPIIIHSNGNTRLTDVHFAVEICVDLLWFKHRGMNEHHLMVKNVWSNSIVSYLNKKQNNFVQLARVMFEQILQRNFRSKERRPIRKCMKTDFLSDWRGT